MEFLIMKVLFVMIGTIPLIKKKGLLKKKVTFLFPEPKALEEADQAELKKILEGEKK